MNNAGDSTFKAMRGAARVVLLVVALVVLSGLLPRPAYAMDEPTSVTLSDISMFQGLLVTGDILAVVPYDIEFASTPTDLISETFIFSMRSENSTAEVAAAEAYPFNDNGYGKGVVSFYLESGGSWGDAYVFRVQQNPAYYPAPQSWDFTIGGTNYSTDADQAAALRAFVIDQAEVLETEFSLDLLTTNDGVTTLATYGERYFMNAIPGLSTMAPDLFSVEIRTPSYARRSWDYAVAAALVNTYNGTFIYDAMTGWAGLFSSDIPTAMNFLSIFLFAVVVFISLKKFKGTTYSALMDGYAFLILLMLDGFFSMIITGFIAFLAAFIGAVILFLNK